MSAFSYMVTVTLPNEAMASAFLAWLQGGHVAEVLAGGALSAQIVSLDQPAHTFEIRYRFASRASFERYEREFAPRLRADGLQRFPTEQGVVYRRTSGVILDER
jgi:hypothetical protein